MGADLIGREDEFGAVERLLGALEDGPAGVLLEGEAGIGKTTVCSAGAEAALLRAGPAAARRRIRAPSRLTA